MDSIDLEKEKRKREIEKHCHEEDAHNAFTQELCKELGPNAEAVIARLFDKHYPDNKDRKWTLRKWQNITRPAKDRFLKI